MHTLNKRWFCQLLIQTKYQNVLWVLQKLKLLQKLKFAMKAKLIYKSYTNRTYVWCLYQTCKMAQSP